MGAVHVRTPKNFVLEERLERYADAIETNPEAYAGNWGEACAPAGCLSFTRLHLDLGCGKGTYLVERARREPDTLFVGMDQEPICIAYAAQKICEQGLSNALVLPRGAASLSQLFAAGELDAITINFPTPQPKAKYAKKRLVHVDHLMLYRPLLAAGATVTLRTDSKPLRDYALGQFAAAGYDTRWVSDDVRRDHPEHPETEYECRTREMGAVVYGICATPGAQPSDDELTAGRMQEQSLACYLPDDLNELTYVPLGMEEAVENFKNRARKGKKRLPQAFGGRDASNQAQINADGHPSNLSE